MPGVKGTISSLLSSGKTELVFRSQVTPEIKIDVASLLTPGPAPASAVQAEGRVALSFIKPEIVIRSLGVEKSVAPYGKPTKDLYTVVLWGTIGAAAIGASLAWWICRRI